MIRVESARDVDLEAGFEPTPEATFSSLSDAEDYIAEWQEVYLTAFSSSLIFPYHGTFFTLRFTSC